MSELMKRREFITLLGGAAAWPVGAHAQQTPAPVVGWLNSGVSGGREHLVTAFRRGMSETGFVDGQNVAIEYRLGRWSIRPIAGARCRSDPSRSGCDRCDGRYRLIARGQTCNDDNSGCRRLRWRSGYGRARRQLESPRRQYHRHKPGCFRHRGEAVGVAARTHADGDRHRFAGESNQPQESATPYRETW